MCIEPVALGGTHAPGAHNRRGTAFSPHSKEHSHVSMAAAPQKLDSRYLEALGPLRVHLSKTTV